MSPGHAAKLRTTTNAQPARATIVEIVTVSPPQGEVTLRLKPDRRIGKERRTGSERRLSLKKTAT
jgi:hypothetical protein